MKQIRMPRTELRPSVICLGGGVSDEQSPLYACYDEYVEQGGNCFDTANLYGKKETGVNLHERVLGRWLSQKPPSFRDGILICTKGGHPPMDHFGEHRLSREDVAADLEESLTALGVETIDLYWLHRDDPGKPVGEILSYLNEFCAQGKIRYFGASNWRASRLREAEAYAKANGLQGFVANQPQWSCAKAKQKALDAQTLVTMDTDAYKFHLDTGITVMPYSPTAKGYFAKLLNHEPPDARWDAVFDSPDNRRRLETLKAVAQEKHCTVTQASLAWLLSQPFPTVPIVGFSSREQLVENLGAVDIVLENAVVQKLRGGK